MACVSLLTFSLQGLVAAKTAADLSFLHGFSPGKT
jgi:hypothetical protein